MEDSESQLKMKAIKDMKSQFNMKVRKDMKAVGPGLNTALSD